jgi:threonine aldolase
MTVIDLRSDTVTKPTPEMREAMHRAEVGDDVYGEDPTVNRLQEMAADAMGKEAALFVSSGTMGNLIALLAHCRRGDEAIVGEASHIALWEQGGASWLGGIILKTVPNQDDGTLNLDTVAAKINPDNVHCAHTRLVCLENTWNGHPISLAYTKSLRQLADSHGLKMHLDGARLFNSATALGVRPADLAAGAHSVQICFSKGLAAPAGSAICGDREFIAEAHRLRKALGGGMRQVGILAAACIVSLEKMTSRLAEDHETARALAEGLAQMPGIEVDASKTLTNMVWFRLKAGDKQQDFIDRLAKSGILVSAEPRFGIRAVTHHGITMADINIAIDLISAALPAAAAQSGSRGRL